jgi:hypothetical protein
VNRFQELLDHETVRFLGKGCRPFRYTRPALPKCSVPNAKEKRPMIQRRLKVVKWLSTTPAVAVCALCGREFRVPTSAPGRTADGQSSLQQQFDRHKCERQDSSQSSARANADVLLRQEPSDEEDEEQDDDRKDEDYDDDDERGGYSE